jgi:peptide/nickel transport system substrate-binding protein
VAKPLKVLLVVGLIAAALFAGTFFLRRDTVMPNAPAAAAGPSGGALVASLRSEPAHYSRYIDASAATDLLALLMHARLVRINRVTDELEPALAESWTRGPDGLTYTLKLRTGVQFSDGAPFSSEDVLFTARALYDPALNADLARAISIGGKPLTFEAPDASTVVVRLPAPYAPGLRLLDSLPILPRHKLEAALEAGQFRDAWKIGTPAADIVGLGPFVLAEHVPGQRLVFSRNPHYWKRDQDGVRLPYLDRLTVSILPDQNSEALRMESGDLDLMSNGDIRPDDYAGFRRASEQGRLRLLDVGIGLDPNLLWFNLGESSAKRAALFREKAFRQAIAHAVDRDAIVNTAYLGAAVPVWGPITPGNRTWYSSAAPQYPFDRARARELLASLSLADRNGDGLLEDRAGDTVEFSILTQRGHTLRERTAAVIQEQLRQVGIAVAVVAVDPASIPERWSRGEYDSIYFGVQASSTDPSIGWSEFWYSNGSFHFWNPRQQTPATEWERRIDVLMLKQEAAPTLAERQQLFAEVQKIFGEEVPALYFVAPRVTIAISSRVGNPQPALQTPQLLWSADTLRALAR